MIKKIKRKLEKPVTWMGYLKLCLYTTILSFAAGAVWVVYLYTEQRKRSTRSENDDLSTTFKS